MNQKQFYKKLLGEKWFKREVLTALLEDIGKSVGLKFNDDDVEIEFSEDGIEIGYEESVSAGCNCCYDQVAATRYIWWSDLVDHFFDTIEKEK